MKNYTHYPALVLAVALISCGPERKSPIKPNIAEPHVEAAPVFRPEDVTFVANVIAETSPNHYSVALRWSSNGKPGAWSLGRAENGGSSVHLVRLDAKASTFTDGHVVVGRTYRYTLGAIHGSRYQTVKEVAVTLGEDVEVHSARQMHGTFRAKRLFLSRGAQITTDGQDLTIEVEELISDDGAISSFTEHAGTFSETDGRGGGNISIRAKSGRGTLHIYARGESGGAGKWGRPGKDGDNGTAGKNGECGYRGDDALCLRWTRDEFEAFRRRTLSDFSAGGQTARDMLNRFYCRIETQDGSAGKSGEKGGPGSNGGKGGDSARVLVMIETPSDIRVRPHVLPGTGGKGGLGGFGGLWGSGGPAGKQDSLGLCRFAMSGPSGSLGPMGDPGRDGANGAALPYCLRLGQTTLGECASFQ